MIPAVPRELALRLEGIESAAWRDAHEAASAADRAALGLRAVELSGAWLMAADRVESLLLNRVLGLGLAQPIGGATLDALVAHYRGRSPGFAVNLCPFAEPAGIESAFAVRGFASFFHHVKWVRGAEPARSVPTSLRLEVAAAADAAAWGALSARVFEHSPGHGAWSARAVGRTGWTHYFACAGEARVGIAAMFVSADAAWLGSAGTLPSHRRRGAQGALLARRIADALARDVRWLTLETAPDLPDLSGESLRNAARAGFHPAYERPSWIWPVR